MNDASSPDFAVVETIRISRPVHLVTIDALRGIAALSVCLFHLGGVVLVKLSTPATAAATSWGVHGVDIFFVISGFVLPYVMLRSRYRWASAPRFLARRFLRVGPPAHVLLIGTIVLYWLIEKLTGTDHWFSQLTVPQLLANFTFLVPFTGQTWVNGVFWTLAVEFQYYLLLALLFPIMVRSLPAAMSVAFGLCAVGALTAGWVSFLGFTGCFFLGGITFAYREGAVSRQMFAALSGLALLLVYAQENAVSLIVTAGTALLIGFVTIDNRFLNFLGKISYSLYLTHILAGSMAEFILLKFAYPANLAARVGLQLLCVGAALIAATLFYHLVERHFVAWSQKIRSNPGPAGNTAGTNSTIAAAEISAAP